VTRASRSMSASPAADRAFAQAAVAAHPGLNIVINNAGVALLGQFSEIDQAQMDWLMNINFWGVVHSHPRLPAASVAQARGAHRQPLQRSSASSRRPARPPMRGEIRGARLFRKPAARIADGGSPVRLSVVHPGGVATNIVRNSRTGSGITDNARRAQSIERFDTLAKTTPPPPRCASSPASRRTSRAS
jgi:NAD(P)-dependent dehydrogenase (short-subunit alcohol dehydrogenase family)